MILKYSGKSTHFIDKNTKKQFAQEKRIEKILWYLETSKRTISKGRERLGANRFRFLNSVLGKR